MKKARYALISVALLACMLYVVPNAAVVMTSGSASGTQSLRVEMLWNSSMAVNDVAVSKDGNFLAAVNSTGLYYFASDNSTPRWWYPSPNPLTSVALSADGQYAVSGDCNAHVYYFNESRTASGQQSSPTWRSVQLGEAQIQAGTLDMSDDGEYVVLGGSGSDLYYLAGCRARSGLGETCTWYSDEPNVLDITGVRTSFDGKYVAACGTMCREGFVMFYTDADTVTPGSLYHPLWRSRDPSGHAMSDLALSDDGYAVATVGSGPLCCWMNATALSGAPSATWINPGGFSSVSMSLDGDRVAAGTTRCNGLRFWGNASQRHGTQMEDWVRLEDASVLGVGMSGDGELLAVSGQTEPSHCPKTYFFTSDGDVIGSFNLSHLSPLVSVSARGGIAAVAGSCPGSLYVFRIVTCPAFLEVHVLSPENKTYNVADVPLTFTVNGSTSWTGYSLDGQLNVTVAGNTTLSSLPDGLHDIIVYASDVALNLGKSDTVYFMVDATPPEITGVTQDPQTQVQPQDEVKINATIIDATSGVKQAFLNYTYTNGTGSWNAVAGMTNLEGDVWNATIPPFPYCTTVSYAIAAEDHAGNVATTEELGYQYHVIPESPLIVLLTLLMTTATLITVAADKRRTRGRPPVSAS